MTQFADVSHHNSVDLRAYRNAGHDRIILKATEDTGFIDPAFADRWTLAGSLGLARTAYHFLRNHNGGAAQFDHFNSVVPQLTAYDMLCLDVEDIDTPGDAMAQTVEFVKKAVSAGYSRGLIYTYKSYADSRHITAGILPAGWRMLWLADYTLNQADSEIELPLGWARSQVFARQFTSTENVPGVTGDCDYNRVLKEWLPIVSGGDGMATWSDTDSANLAAVANKLDGIYRSGFASRNPDGTDDPTHLAVSVRGTNQALGTVNDHLSGIHMAADALVDAAAALLAAVQALGGSVAPVVPTPASETPAATTAAPEMDSTVVPDA